MIGAPSRRHRDSPVSGSRPLAARPGYRHGSVSEDFVVTCPYCGEDVDVRIESDVRGSFVQDCEVCCSPWLLRVEGEDDERSVTATRADGSE